MALTSAVLPMTISEKGSRVSSTSPRYFIAVLLWVKDDMAAQVDKPAFQFSDRIRAGERTKRVIRRHGRVFPYTGDEA